MFLLVAIYFCLIPSPLRISPETTGYTEPLTPSGDVDYFGVYEKTYIDKLSPPEDNGQRLLIAACGPVVLEQVHIANTVPWEEMPTNPRSKNWFEKQWIPLCEHMYIDPYARPKYFDSHGFYGFMYKEWEANKKEGDSRNVQADTELWNQLVSAPWTAEEHPDVARWLEERSPVLDLFGVAVRKPNFVCWRWRNDSLTGIMLPDVQANREFARDLRIRITERLGRGDIDGAWYDVMSMFYLSRKHYIHDQIYVTNLVGIAIEGQGWEAAKIILQYGKPTPEQLERFANDLAALPRKMTLKSTFETSIPYAWLRGIRPGLGLDKAEFGDFFDGYCNRKTNPIEYLFYLPIDHNIAGKRISEFNNIERKKSGDSAWNINPTVRRKHAGERDVMIVKKKEQLKSPWNLLRVPLIHTRSQMVADYLLSVVASSNLAVQTALDRSNAQLDLLRVAVALERYKAAKGDYPATLDALVPTFLEEVPLDPFTARLTLTYRPEPKDGRPFVLYSFGPNALDDGGTPCKSQNWAECDIVW